MKYIVVLCDGMSGYKLESLGNKTTMEKAAKPNMERLASEGIVGLVKTVPKGMPPGSDVANLSAMGFNPLECYTGRSPIEAVSMGVKMQKTDVAFRCNLITLTDESNYANKIMKDYSAEEITTEEALPIINALNEAFKSEKIEFYHGISYRHCMIWKDGHYGLDLVPPHDISDKPIGKHLPKEDIPLDIMKKSYDVLKDHPVNVERIKNGLNPANAIWLWGEGTTPEIANFEETTGLKGAVISAVDLIKGIGICAGMEVIEVEGATGNINTNFENKGLAAYNALKNGNDYVYVHIEAPDECGHRGEADNKIKSIEYIDEKVIGPLLKMLEDDGEEYKMLVMPDHPTPIATKTHATDPVPFLIYDSRKKVKGVNGFTEKNAENTGLFFSSGKNLAEFFLK